MKTENVIFENKTVAMIVRAGMDAQGVEFYTPDDNVLQMGKHCHPSGKIIKPHKHCPVRIERWMSFQEALYIEEGKVRVTFYSAEGQKVESKTLNKGDLILLMEGGHGFEFLEKTKMIEVKQGPYMPESRKSLEIRDSA